MKSAERGEINTHNLVMCSKHYDKGRISKSPCTCVKAPTGTQQSVFQTKASQNFQKTFRSGNFVYHGNRHSNDFSTIQTKQPASGLQPNSQSPFT